MGYVNLPERLISNRELDQTGFYFGIIDGQIKGGAGCPTDMLALEGFHVVAPWAAIASQSALLYDHKGSAMRSRDEKQMWKDLMLYADTRGVTPHRVFARKAM